MEVAFDMVIHTQFGGFSLTQEIVERLRKRGCPWVDEIGRASSTGPWYLPYREGDEDELRRDEHLLAVVRELTEELEARVQDVKSWRERAEVEQELLHGLKVVTVHVGIDIEEDDGKERVRVYGGAS
jgi:hypothetical protein